MIHAKYQMFDLCNTLDRFHALEITERVDTENRRHLDYVLDILIEKSQPPQHHQDLDSIVNIGSRDIPSVEFFKESLHKIPSLDSRKAFRIVEDMCRVFKEQAFSTDLKSRETLLFQLIRMGLELRDMCCCEADRNQLMTVCEAAREKAQNKRLMENLLDAIQRD
ncbi:hypothetical protein BDR26DRAFT_863804 [Obelidium mucronatum]|nr:hypothetical protein BDR26DRAFT_863804 [Obelidium mucronatum]